MSINIYNHVFCQHLKKNDYIIEVLYIIDIWII